MIKKATAILLASMILAMGIDGFIVPYQLLDGGMIGIGLIIKYTFGFRPGLTILFFSLPIYIFIFFYRRRYFYNSLHGLLISSFFIDLFAPLRGQFHLPLIMSAILGGLLVGIGIGTLLRFETSTGGLDLLALFIADKWPLNVGIIILIMDASILIIGSETAGINLAFSTVIVCLAGLMTTLLTVKSDSHS
ncbi:YitT family protein [Tuberibacillus sp. Marseille-P3662]|uniref:YitT family protein n=1 Tax=Tuberibacillus sp. Marseille-P3662 TaxID=1965358 RepID=UPI000A1CC7EE|nr:YitT family protein [Tuberibacillus sp. Marseille-P3662]